MVNWKSPEEAEAWWSELRELEKKVAELERRLVETSKRAHASFIGIVMSMSTPETSKYITERGKHYGALIDKCKTEDEMSNYLFEFMKEIRTYRDSG